MSRISTIALLGVSLVFPAANTCAADLAHGADLVAEHCVRCHDDSMYTREGRIVTSLPGLHKQVRRCEQMLNLIWFDEDVADVAAYLNQTYYRFEP